MQKKELRGIELIGLAFPGKTTNENGQASIDCGSLWLQFTEGDYANKVPNKIDQAVLAVYHDYDGDYTKPYAYFIGCRVEPGTEAPEGMTRLTIPEGSFQTVVAKGKMPDCIVEAWKNIWSSDIPRAYKADFELYDGRSADWANAEVEIYLSVN